MTFSLKGRRDLHGLYLKLHSSCAEPQTVTLHAFDKGNGRDNFSVFGETVTSQAAVPPGENWVFFPFLIPIEYEPFQDRCYIQVWLDPAEGISWRSVERLSNFESAGEQDKAGQWSIQRTKGYRYSVKEPAEKPADCAPENVINGYSRIVDAEHYEWVSDPEQTLPQWIELTFAQPAEIDTVSLVFDTDMNTPGTCWGVEGKTPGVPQCVKDYDVEIFTDGRWSRVAEVSGNFMRRRTHRFDAAAVEKLRVTVRATWGDKSARITEIRAGLES
jgi:hypothetical protein